MKKLELVKLDAKQEKLWDDTRVALLWHCPAFSHILYTLMNKVDSKHIAVFTKDVPVAATDGVTLMINPETFFPLKLEERVFVCGHEILHCILNHCIIGYQFGKRGSVPYPDGVVLPYSHELMNVAMDLVINDILVESKVGLYNKKWLHDASIATANDSVLDAYRKLYEKCAGKGGGKGDGSSVTVQGNVSGEQFDEHLDPGTSQGKDAHSASQDRNTSEWNTGVAAAMHSAKVQGKLPAGLERLLNEVLEPQVDWREHIQSLFARKVGGGTYDWQKPDRRLIVRDIIAPGRSGFGAGDVVVAVDTSGSIGDRELSMFFGEMYGILDTVKPKRLFVMWCDAKVHRVDEIEDLSELMSLRRKGAPGGGGTSFIPVFEEMEDMGIEPDALVYLTDGMGSFPAQAPSFPVIWGNIYEGSQYPFGDVVDIPKQAA
ncbi:vWA domain-containing protein [Pseudolabrys sp.]|uniref:vWA domain-containing protein n=1 Tax=Pseudolabrys sp. TaxID=1960880 RepID=UPI003D13F77E